MPHACHPFWKCHKTLTLANFWKGPQSLALAARKHMWTSKSGPNPRCFQHCFAPQRRALFRHRNSQKWSEHGALCTFWLGNAFCATTACTFSSLIWPAGSAPAALASLLFDPPEPQIIEKPQSFVTFLPFRAPGSSFFWDFLFFLFSSSLFFSSLLFSFLLFSSLLFSDSSHLCFSSAHIVGNLTSKLPSANMFNVHILFAWDPKPSNLESQHLIQPSTFRKSKNKTTLSTYEMVEICFSNSFSSLWFLVSQHGTGGPWWTLPRNLSWWRPTRMWQSAAATGAGKVHLNGKPKDSAETTCRQLLNYIEIWVVNGVQTLYANLIVLMVVFHHLCGSGVYSTHMPTKWFIWHLWVSFILLQDLQYASWPSAGFPPLWSSDTARWGLSDRCLLSSIVLPRNLLHPFQASKTEISLVFWLVCSRAGHQWMAWRKVFSFWCWY